MAEDRSTKRPAILKAAVLLFIENGYAGTSLRDIGREAGADASLVIHYFGSKEGLFLEAMRAVQPERPLQEGDIQGLGERFIRFVLEAGPQVRASFLAVLHAGQTPTLNDRLREQNEDRAQSWLGGHLEATGS